MRLMCMAVIGLALVCSSAMAAGADGGLVAKSRQVQEANGELERYGIQASSVSADQILDFLERIKANDGLRVAIREAVEQTGPRITYLNLSTKFDLGIYGAIYIDVNATDAEIISRLFESADAE